MCIRDSLHYNASDIGSGIRNLQAQFRNEESNQTIYGTDNDVDGVITFSLSNDLFSGDYTLTQLYVQDDNFNQNRTDYSVNGTETARTWDADDKSWDYFSSVSDIDVSDLKITVTDEVAAQTNLTASTITAVDGSETDDDTIFTEDRG